MTKDKMPKRNPVRHKTAQSKKIAEQSGNRHTFSPADDNAALPFAVENLDANGRIVRLGNTLNRLITRHDYPEPVAALLAESVVLTALLGSSLKFQGKFSLQAQTDGAVSLIVCDYTAATAEKAASLRAYARFDKHKLEQIPEQANGDNVPQAALLGKGSLAFTIDQGAHMQLYQGIVALDGHDLEQAAQQYFLQSEQIPTKIRLATALLTQRDDMGKLQIERRGGGILAQHLPQNSQGSQTKRKQETNDAADAEDKWREAELLTATVTDAELTDPNITAERVLYRLFHQQIVRVFPPAPIEEHCSCSREKLSAILANFSEEELRQSIEDGKISVTCQFCSAVYEFSPEEFIKTQ